MSPTAPAPSQARKTAMTSSILKEALDAHSLLSLDPENRILAETRQKALLNLQNIQFDAMQEGLQKGLQKGRAEGKQEGQREAMILVAKRLLKQGPSLEQISMITELNPDEIQKLLG
jgi:predicted transposase/invertase (TIGR01784 family)